MDIPLNTRSKEETYLQAINTLPSIIEEKVSKEVNILNVFAFLKDAFNYSWIGFYWVKESNNQKELTLGLFQGPLACTSIEYHKGVCGTSWAKNETQIVPNVHAFKGHIACSYKTLSEIVIPISKNGNVIGVLDVDSETLNAFTKEDEYFLLKVISSFEKHKLI